MNYLDDEGVENSVFHAADVEVEDLEGLALQNAYDPDHLARDPPRQRPQQHVGARQLGLDVRHRRVAAGAQLLDDAEAAAAVRGAAARRGARRRRELLSVPQLLRPRAGTGAQALALLLRLQRLHQLLQLFDELYRSPYDRSLVSLTPN